MKKISSILSVTVFGKNTRVFISVISASIKHVQLQCLDLMILVLGRAIRILSRQNLNSALTTRKAYSRHHSAQLPPHPNKPTASFPPRARALPLYCRPLDARGPIKARNCDYGACAPHCRPGSALDIIEFRENAHPRQSVFRTPRL